MEVKNHLPLARPLAERDGLITPGAWRPTRRRPGRKRLGVQGAHLNPLGLFLRTSIHFIWRIMSAFLPA
jgi:hypothetical protein